MAVFIASEQRPVNRFGLFNNYSGALTNVVACSIVVFVGKVDNEEFSEDSVIDIGVLIVFN